ncbi:MAG: arylsulfatase [Mariniblastus sp.]
MKNTICRTTFAFLFSIAASFTLTAAGNEESSKAPRPNIIVILVDDMGFSDIGCYGSEIETPNLDGLAANGLRFTQFYNSGRCCPTRASLMTGLHPHQAGIGHMTAPPNKPLGITGAYQGYLNDNCTTLAHVLRSADYHTLMTGKWHLGSNTKSAWPLQRGFDRFYGGYTGAFNYIKPGGDRKMSRGNEPVETDENFYVTDTFTDEACKFISDATKKDEKPFFLYLAYNAPHWPLQPKWDDFQKYKGKYTGGWEQLMKDRLAKQKEIGLFENDISPAPHVGPKWDSLKEAKQKEMDTIMAAYAGCVDSIDQNIGKLTEHLKSIDQFDNTVIFFLSDNGACQEGGVLGQYQPGWEKDSPLETVDGIKQGLAWANASNTPFRLYKHFVHEGGACTPMIAHWPNGIAKEKTGSFVRQFGYLPDFMATCIELSGASYPADIPMHAGASLVPLLKGTDQPVHTTPIYWEHEGNAAMRWGDFKLVREYEKPWELFNIAVDRTEMNDLAESESAKKNEMITMWESWATKHEVAFPERFHMYKHLNKQKKKNKPKKKSQKKAG